MASETRMGETPPRWRRPQDAAQDPRLMEGTGLPLPRSVATELALPGYPEPCKLSYGAEKGCPWRGSQGCLGTSRELTGSRLGCPYPPSPQCLRGALCHPKDGAELLPRNGQPKAGWAEPCKEHPGPRWAEAVLAPLALYSHAYHQYPLPFPGIAGKSRSAAAGDGAGDPAPLRHCPFLVETKRSPFLLSSLVATGHLAEPSFGATEGAGTMGDGRFVGIDWHLGTYPPSWGHPLYVGVPTRGKGAAPAPFSDSSKEFYPKKEPGYHPPAKDQMAPQRLGKGQGGQDRDGEGESVVPELPAAPWRDGRVGGSSAVPTPHAHTPPPSASHPLFLLQPGTAGCCRVPWVGTQPPATALHPEPGPGRPLEHKDEQLAPQSHHQSGSPVGLGEAEPCPLAKSDPPSSCLSPTPGCDGCPGVGCGVLGPLEPTMGISGGHFQCPPSNHTKLKKTWLTRHSEQSLPRCRAPRRDGAHEVGNEGKRSAKRPHGPTDGARAASEGARAAKRGTKGIECGATLCQGDGTQSQGDPQDRRMELGEGDPPDPWCLQTVPCTALPQSIPRCWACAGRDGGDPKGEEEEEEEDPPESTCRLLHFRWFSLGDSGELSVAGLCTLTAAGGATLPPNPERWGRTPSSSLWLAKHLLGVLGDPFCGAVRRDRELWPRAPGRPEGVMAWRRGPGAPRLCDRCQQSIFNSHWSCPRCGFQLCPECHRSSGQEPEPHEGPAGPPQCIPGQRHHMASSLVPTQFIPSRVLTQLWQLLHQVRVQFSIECHCPCGEGAEEQSRGGTQELPGAAVAPPPPSDDQADPSHPIKEESAEGGGSSPGQPPQRGGAMQPSTLCDLLASTAVKLCLGQDGVRMAFAPVSPALPSDNGLTSILDSIIAQVVERKIQERQEGSPLGPPTPHSPSCPTASHCLLAPSGLLWLQDPSHPSHPSNYRLFQEHWQRGQPVLVSGLQKKLEGRLWGPESFQSPQQQQELEAVDLRVPARLVRVGTHQFWDGFAASAASPDLEKGTGKLLKLECGLGDEEQGRATNLAASLPLPEYCGATGRLNLATYLQKGQRGQRWLRPRLCVAYGIRPQDRAIGTKPLTLEAADSITILVHTSAAQREMLPDADGVDPLLRERLWDASSRPGALWHIFRPEDAGCIREFLRKVSEDQGQEGGTAEEPPARYLDASLRRRLREECGVNGWTLLQFLGDAVLVPAGAPHQVQSLTGTISVEQRFLSPESITRLRDHGPHLPGAARQLRAQLDNAIFSAVREAVEVLQGCK